MGAALGLGVVPGLADLLAARLLLALAAAVGSMGLAYISFVRERKAFDQSLDYAHMNKLFQRQLSNSVDTPSGRRQLLGEALDEHRRWAVRMAGQFTGDPS
jgi:hypothetical protein